MTHIVIKNILDGINTNLALSPSNKTKQLQLYVWNTALSEALYTPIQGLEIVTRNYFHQKLSETYGSQWYDNKSLLLHYPQMHSISQAKESLSRERKTINPGSIIAILSFGFWTGLLGSKYANNKKRLTQS